MDLIIRGGTLVTSGGTMQTDIGIADGRIVAITSGLSRASKIVDASGKLVLPGGVDVHVHFNPPFAVRPETRHRIDDFHAGSRAAAAGGITTYCDFAVQQRGSSLREGLRDAYELASVGSCIDYSFHIIVQDPTPDAIAEVADLVDEGFSSFKFFTQHPAFMTRGPEYLKMLAEIASHGGLAMFHCEDGSIIDHCTENLFNEEKTGVENYPDSRPREVEISATSRVMQMAAITKVPTYVVHLSCEAALNETRRARAQGLPVHVETRPIYLYLTEEVFAQADEEAAKYVGVPPLRDASDQQVLWDALRAGDIHTVQSDHAGYVLGEKYKAGDTFADVPPGLSNVETLLPMLYSEGVRKGRLTLERFVELISTNPAKLFGLYPKKGTIAVGSDADLCVFDPEKEVSVESARMHSATDYDVYEGLDVTGWPVMTIVRGEIAFDGEKILAEPGQGRLVDRSAPRGL